MDNKVKFKIGEIEFEAEGSAEVVERERNVFLNALLPAAVEAIVRTRGAEKAVQYISANSTPALMDSAPQDVLPLSTNPTMSGAGIDFSRTSRFFKYASFNLSSSASENGMKSFLTASIW